jgi:hypothetical protein
MTTHPESSPEPNYAEPAKAICVRIFGAFARGDLADFEALFDPRAVNREAGIQRRNARQGGPAGFCATAL